jgi:NADH-quinone oxidoreductase subunit C
MEFDEIAARIQESLATAAPRVEAPVAPDPKSKERTSTDGIVHVAPAAIIEVCEYLRDDPDLRFDLLLSVTAVDRPDPKDEASGGAFEIVYHLLSSLQNHRLVVKTTVPRNAPKLPTISGVYKAASWHERETFDFFGIDFEGHPDLRRILCCDDWVGHPLRKDYVFPEEYHGISAE